MSFTFAEALHALVDLVPWREESAKLDAHGAITIELESGANDGAHADAGPVEATSSGTTTTAAAGKADKTA